MKKILIGLVAILLLFTVIGLFLPTEYTIERSVTVNATPEEVHAMVDDLKKWPEWMPWWDMDDSIEVTYGDKTVGQGASQSWTGEDGDADIEITKSTPNGIEYLMHMNMFGKKLPSHGFVTYEPPGELEIPSGLKVTWKMDGDMAVPVLGGYFALGSDNMIGGAFQDGLLKLKAAVEGS